MEDDLITVGIILGPRGLKGQLRVESFSDLPGRFTKGESFTLNGMERVLRNTIDGTKGLILEFVGIDSRECAEKYRRCELKISPERSEKLIPRGSYFHHEIIGMVVLDEKDVELGKVIEIIVTGANDVYVISNAIDRDILIPAISSVVREICVEDLTMRINLPKGLNTRL